MENRRIPSLKLGEERFRNPRAVPNTGNTLRPKNSRKHYKTRVLSCNQAKEDCASAAIIRIRGR